MPPQDNTNQPQPVVTSTPQPQPTQEPPQSSSSRVSLSPFHHVWVGVKTLFKTNIKSLVLLGLIQALFLILSVGLLLGMIAALAEIDNVAVSVLGAAVGIAVFILVNTLLSLALSRVILTGVRGEKTTVKAAFKVAKNRIGLLFQLVLYGILAVIALAILAVLLAAIHDLLAFLFGIVIVVSGVILFLHWLYTPLVLVDDTKPASGIIALFTSTKIWQASKGATLLYIGLIILIQIAFYAIPDGSNGSDSYTYDYNSTTTYEDFDEQFSDVEETDNDSNFALLAGAGVGLFTVYMILATLFSAMLNSGQAHIYEEAKNIKPTA